MTNQIQSSKPKKEYDLIERTSIFGENVLNFLKTIKETTILRPIILQVVRSATSIGANYTEADCAESKKDFNHKISISKKESKETSYWFRMLATAIPERKEECRKLWKESHELTLIFSSILIKKN